MVSVLHKNLVSCRVGFVLSCFYKSNFSCSLLVARTVQPFFLLSFDLVIIPAWRIEIIVFPLATERNQIRGMNFDPLLFETRGVFFWKAFRENLSTFFSGRVRRLFSARTEYPYTSSKNWSGYMRSFLGAQSLSCETKTGR